ncbi:MAG: BNR-4 repeat-containing protein [Mariniblastus sp.]
MTARSPSILLACSFLAVCFTSPALGQLDYVDGTLLQFNDNGAWSWFEDERAIVDASTNQLLVSSISDSSGALGRTGDVDVATFNLQSRRTQRFTLNGGLVADDHNSAALLKMSNGRYLAAYSNHNSDNLTRTRISSAAGDTTAWTSEQTRNNGAGTTYNNLFQLSGENDRIYNFTRTLNFDPNFLVSDDSGQSWSYGGKLINGGSNSTRPYLKFSSNKTDTIHFINTENHPRNFNNSVYHATIRGGEVFDSFGSKIDDLDANGMASNAGTRIFAGDADNVGWVSDIHLDSTGNPYVAFSVQKPGNGTDHRYHYGRFDGAQWNVQEIAYAGSRLYAGEDDYTGNIALNPNNPNEVYISTNADPVTGQALISQSDNNRHYEIFRGTTVDQGQTWQWTEITKNSTQDNLRPIIPEWDSQNRAVMWMRGTYTTYTNYDLAVVGLVDQAGQSRDDIFYIDANTTNTKLENGGEINPTSGSGQGANDGRWHLRSGFGNEGDIFAAGENGNENAGLLETIIGNDGEAGTFDVFAYFWSNRNEEWEFSAGLDPTEMDFFARKAAQHVGVDDFLNLVEVGSGNERMYQAYLGRISLDQDELFSVFINDRPDGSGGTRRTWYDGVGLARVNSVPEPSSLALVIGTLFTIALKRRRS